MKLAKRKCVALVPARSGSTRITDKNIKMLAGHPLIAYAICGALASDIFVDVIVSTDSEEYANIAEEYGANIPFMRPPEFAVELSTDYEWLNFSLKRLIDEGYEFDSFAILRPTNPFRTKETILRAWKAFVESDCIDSIRAVQPCSEHPGKMWTIRGELLTPILPYENNGIPWHNCPYQDLPEVFIQNASLEIAYNRTVLVDHSISGFRIAPFMTKGFEGFDINKPADFLFAEYLVEKGLAVLPNCKKYESGELLNDSNN